MPKTSITSMSWSKVFRELSLQLQNWIVIICLIILPNCYYSYPSKGVCSSIIRRSFLVGGGPAATAVPSRYFLMIQRHLNIPKFQSTTRVLVKQMSLSLETCIVDGTPRPVLDKTAFNSTLPLIAVKIPSQSCSLLMKSFKNYLFDRPKMKRIYNVPNDPLSRYLLLSESIQGISEECVPKIIWDYVLEHKLELEHYSFALTYENLSTDEVLKQILPSGIDIPSSYEQAGHIAHLNLRDEQLPFKNIIGQVIIDKNPAIKTVVNKIGQIETEFRTFPMELLAGDDQYDVVVRESNARFQFNFKTVYWNSRLQAEHARLIDLIGASSDANTVVADMMAGVGPFAVPLAKESVKCHANDLNPESHKYLVVNAKSNHCGNNLHCYNLDGREFILKLVDRNIQFTEVIMNLPQNATDFLDVFIGIGTRFNSKKESDDFSLPRIHCYAFSTAVDPIFDIANRCAGVLECGVEDLNYSSDDICDSPDRSICWGHVVRDVSPKKVMVCISFTLPHSVAFSSGTASFEKKRKREDHIDSDRSSPPTSN